jgi:hypothetical protein
VFVDSHRPVTAAASRELRTLHREHGDEVDIFCAHDPWEFRRSAGYGLSVELAPPLMGGA